MRPPPAAAQPSQSPLVCATPTIFVAQANPTQLWELAYGAGAVNFSTLGLPWSGNGRTTAYNAVGFDEADRYLYGVSNLAGPTGNLTSDLLRIGQDGSIVNLGTISGLSSTPATPSYNSGAFFDGTFYIIASGDHTLYSVDVANRVATPMGLSGATWASQDFTQVGRYLWGVNPNTIQRIDPSTGVVTSFPQTVLSPAGPNDAQGGAVWTFGNGNLGVSSNISGAVSQIEIDNPGGSAADPPTFRLISQSQGPASTLNDGSSCVPEVSDTDLTITKSGPVAVQPGGQIQWTLRVTNHGPANSSGFSVTDQLPAGVTGVTSDTAGCSVNAETNTVTWVGGALGVASRRLRGGRQRNGLPTSMDCVLTGTASGAIAGTCVFNSASVHANENDPDLTNNTSDELTTCVGQAADLSITKHVKRSPAVPGRRVVYTLVVHNGGPDAAEKVVVSDPLPAGLSFVSASPGCAFSGGVVTCRSESLAADASLRIRVVAHLASSATDGVVNSAHVTSDTLDWNLANNDATVSTPIGPKADLSLSKATFPGTVLPGGQVSYTLVATNHGPSLARDVTVSDPLPAGMTLVSATAQQGRCAGGPDVRCSLGSLPVGGSVQVLVTVRVSAAVTGSVENTAVVAGGHPDPDLNNNSARTAVVVGPPEPPDAPESPTLPVAPPPPARPGHQPISDVGIVKSVNRIRARPGQQLTYTLRVTNHGPHRASSVVVTDTSTRPLRSLRAVPAHGTCRLVPAPLRCSLDAIRVGATVRITILAQARGTGPMRNAVTVTSADHDPRLTNNIHAAAVAISTPRPHHHRRRTHRPPHRPPRFTG